MRLTKMIDDSSSGRSQGEKHGMGPVKRSRSSLDYKVRNRSNNGSPTTTKPGKRKNRQQQQQQQQQQQNYDEEQMKQQQQMYAPRQHMSRARGHSGPPPRKWELADLQKMNEEELLQALYADPELAQEAARMAEKIAKEKGPPLAGSKGAPRRRSSTTTGKRGARQELSDYPDHMRELMDGGVPVMQWVILLVLLGAAFYQLKKILSLPDTKDHHLKKRPRAKGTKKNKAGVTERISGFASVEEAARAIEPDIASSAQMKGVPKPNKKVVAAATNKKKVKKEGKGKPTHVTPTTSVKKEPESSDEASVDDDDMVPVRGVPKPPTAVPVPPAVSTFPMSVGNGPTTTAAFDYDVEDDNGAGWQTVSKTRTAVEATTVVVSAKEPIAKTTTTSGEKKATTMTAESKENTPPSVNGKSDTAGKKKKKKKDKNNDADAADMPTASTNIDEEEDEAAMTKQEMDNDAALAQKLQHEEEKMVQGGNGAARMDVWEEVSTRKRKGN